MAANAVISALLNLMVLAAVSFFPYPVYQKRDLYFASAILCSWGGPLGDESSAAAKQLTATVHVEKDVTVVEVSGRMIGGEETSLLRERIKWLFHSTTNVILNLSGITFIDSAGLGVLVSMWTSSKSVGRVLKLASVQGKVKQALEVTRLNSIFEIYDTTGEAMKDVRKK